MRGRARAAAEARDRGEREGGAAFPRGHHVSLGSGPVIVMGAPVM